MVKCINRIDWVWKTSQNGIRARAALAPFGDSISVGESQLSPDFATSSALRILHPISIMEGVEPVESPRKRVKVDNESSTEEAVLPGTGAAADSEPAKTSESDAQAMKELEVGITQFVSADNEGFSGILKKRYGCP